MDSILFCQVDGKNFQPAKIVTLLCEQCLSSSGHLFLATLCTYWRRLQDGSIHTVASASMHRLFSIRFDDFRTCYQCFYAAAVL